MRIIKGRGNNRRLVLEVPTGRIVQSAPPEEQKAFTALMCSVLGVSQKEAVAS